MTNSRAFETALSLCHKSTVLGNKIAIHMLEFLGTTKHQPQGLEELARDFLELCKIMWSIEAGLVECKRTGQHFPTDVIVELDKKFKQSNSDFLALDHMISKFLEYDKRGTMGRLQRGWRKMFAEDDVGKMSSALGATRDALKMSALMFQWSLGESRIDESVGIGYTGLAAALDRLAHGRSVAGINKVKSLEAHHAEHERSLAHSSSFEKLPPLPSTSLNGRDEASMLSPGLSSNHSHMSPPSAYTSRDDHTVRSQRIRRHASMSGQTTSSHGDRNTPHETRDTLFSSSEESSNGLTDDTVFSDIDLSDSHGPIKVVRLKADPSSMPRWAPRTTSINQTPSFKTALISAVQARNASVVEQLLDRGVSPDTGLEINVLNESVLHHDLETARQLLMFGADANSVDSRGLTPLFLAVEHSFLDGAALLLKYGADPNLAAGMEHETPLAVAAVENKFQFTRLLLMYGGDANHKLSNGETVLMKAISRKCSQKVIDLLLDYDADPNLKSRKGESPLFEAINAGRVDTVTSLLDHGANPNLPGPKHMLWPAIHQTGCLRVLLARGADYKKAPGIMEQAASTNNLDSVRVLLEAGVDPNAKKDGVYTPLCTSIRDDLPEIFHLLLAKGADPNVPASEYPAFKCVTHFRPQYMQPLVDAGADLRSPKGIIETAVQFKNVEALKWLLKAGVSPNDRTPKTNATPLTTSIREKRKDFVQMLLENGADPNIRGEDWPVFLAVHEPEILKLILPYLKEPRAYKGVMERAVVANQLESLKLLLNAGVSVEDRNGGVFSPLTSAIRDRQKNFVKYLIDEAGADVNAPGEHLPIVKALRRYEGEDYEIIEMLLAKGADPNKIYRGHSGFIQAIENGDSKVLQLLVDRCGVDLSAQDDQGQTIAEIAESRGWDEGLEIILAGSQK
ncbi:ankyrin repeat-containing domain protein [Microdochium trichocladiopsis]|uniref:Ankyrin repeat-containing domain protein n=1 Tax=Microdochium trichocladiopsis TaxID=1682393 RepID=A0A9P8Y5S7_9PEZI|nr:ankyrin repeat-containing domain protein [Microdochium trichocladiopsis]KAH7029565.1 ankyrin repeat-containing domain protein [Microdochium trichocladiopsis]